MSGSQTIQSSSSTLFPSVNDQDDDVKKVQLSHIYFGPTTKSKYLASQRFTDLGILFRPNAHQISICFNRLRDEIVIPFSEVLGYKLTGEREIIVHLKPNFQRQYYHHSDTYPFSIIKDDDPTKGLIIGVNSLLLKSYHSFEFEFLQTRGFAVKNNGKIANEIICNNKDRRERGREMDSRPTSVNVIPVQTASSSSSHFLLPQQGTAPDVIIEKHGTVVAITQRVNLNEKARTKETYYNKPEPRLSQIKQNQSHQESQASIGNSTQTQQQSQPFRRHSLQRQQLPKTKYSPHQPSQKKIGAPNQSPSAPTTLKTIEQKQQLYVTCIFAIEKRALCYPQDGTLHHLNYIIRKRFNKYEWTSVWYKNKSKENENWSLLNSEEDWKFAKNGKEIKNFVRIDLYFR